MYILMWSYLKKNAKIELLQSEIKRILYKIFNFFLNLYILLDKFQNI